MNRASALLIFGLSGCDASVSLGARVSHDTRAIVAGDDYGCAILAARVACFGTNLYGIVGRDEYGTFDSTYLASLDHADELVGGRHFACARQDGQVLCWGGNDHGELGRGIVGDGAFERGSVAPTALVDVQSIFAGAGTACAIDGAGSLWCWGRNDAGQSAPDDSSDDVAAPTRVPLVDAITVAPGELHTCALVRSGDVYCWGDGTNGELGDGTRSSHRTPTRVPTLTGIVSIATTTAGRDAAFGTTCALVDDGRVLCWGSDDAGQSGNGEQPMSDVPQDVDGPADFERLVAGPRGVMARRRDGRWYAWGYASLGALGVATPAGFFDRPTEATRLRHVPEVSLAFTHAVGIDDRGRFVRWGSSPFGALPGVGPNEIAPDPVVVPPAE